jgi:hypothetical protein
MEGVDFMTVADDRDGREVCGMSGRSSAAWGRAPLEHPIATLADRSELGYRLRNVTFSPARRAQKAHADVEAGLTATAVRCNARARKGRRKIARRHAEKRRAVMGIVVGGSAARVHQLRDRPASRAALIRRSTLGRGPCRTHCSTTPG